MSIRLVCPGCRKQLAVPDAVAGQMGRCPACDTLFNVPANGQAAPRRTAVARPIPQPVLGEDAPATGLTVGQKIGFAVVAAGVLAVVSFFVYRAMNANGPAPGEARQAVADASGQAPPPRKEAEPSKPAPGPSVPESKPPVRINPVDAPSLDGTLPEEDVGPKTNPLSRPPVETPPPKPPIVTNEPPPDPPLHRDPPPKTAPALAKLSARDNGDDTPITRPQPPARPIRPAPQEANPPKPPMVRLAEFAQRWPRIERTLFGIGVDAKQVRAKLDDRGFRGFVKTFPESEVLHLRKGPSEANLIAGQIYEFEIESPTALSMAANSNGKLHPFTKRGTVFSAKISAPLGNLKIMAQLPGKGKVYWGLLEYQVEAGAAAGP